MRCPICGKDVILTKKQIGADESGAPIFNEYAVCRDCKKQWNLDKQRAKKAAAATEAKPAAPAEKEAAPAEKKVTEKKAAPAEKPQAPKKRPRPKAESAENPARTPVNADKPASSAAPEKKPAPKKRPRPKTEGADDNDARTSAKPAAASARKQRPVKAASATEAVPAEKKPAPKKRPPRPEGAAETAPEKRRKKKTIPEVEEQQYGNIPSVETREIKEKAVKKAYEDMLSTDPSAKKKKKEEPAPKKEKTKTEEIYEDEDDEDDEYWDDEPVGKFRPVRTLFGILSILAFAYFTYSGFLAGLENISSGNGASTGTTYIVLAICMLVSGLLLLIMQRRRTVFAFILPMVFYLGSAVYAFLMRESDQMLLYGAIGAGVCALIFLILAILSARSSDDEDEDFDDPFEDNYDD